MTGYRFPLIRDAGGLFREKLNNPISTTHAKAKTAPGGYVLQPAVYVYHLGELKSQWQQTPKLINLAGAANRVSVIKVMTEVHRF